MIHTSDRLQKLSTQYFAALGVRIAQLQAEGKHILRLDIGSPDMAPAPHILDAMAKAVHAPDVHGYGSHKGPADLRQAWAAMYFRVHGVYLDPESEIIPLMGSKEGIFHLSQAYLNPGDVSLIPDPGYVTYEAGASFAGADAYLMPLTAERNFLPDLSAIPEDVLRRAKMLWLNYPNNPTAAVAPKTFFAEAVEFARKHNLLLCHDAAYSQVGYDGYQPPSILEIPGAKEVAVEFNSLSKSHNMAGWRVGALAGNPDAVRSLFMLKTNLDSGHFPAVHHAAIAAMTGDQEWLWDRNEIYRQRRDILLDGLRSIGLNPTTPQASLYVWSPVPEGKSSLEFTTELLENAGVSFTPGSVFGLSGEGFMRIAVSSPTEQVEEAVARLIAWLGK